MQTHCPPGRLSQVSDPMQFSATERDIMIAILIFDDCNLQSAPLDFLIDNPFAGTVDASQERVTRLLSRRYAGEMKYAVTAVCACFHAVRWEGGSGDLHCRHTVPCVLLHSHSLYSSHFVRDVHLNYRIRRL